MYVSMNSKIGFLFILCILYVCLCVYVVRMPPLHTGDKEEHLVCCYIPLHLTPLKQSLSLSCLLTFWSIFSPSDTDQGMSKYFCLAYLTWMACRYLSGLGKMRNNFGCVRSLNPASSRRTQPWSSNLYTSLDFHPLIIGQFQKRQGGPPDLK